MEPDNDPQEPVFEAGSIKSIIYSCFQLLDEILHFFDRFKWMNWWTDTIIRVNFCCWCYRYDWCHRCNIKEKGE